MKDFKAERVGVSDSEGRHAQWNGYHLPVDQTILLTQTLRRLYTDLVSSKGMLKFTEVPKT